uniref:Ubiquitin-like protease family profile domain-containing protein n=1 Tax=Ditylenchus dipsaci TaxID=166011 RepID=A0A915DMI0_9BILA
MILGHKPVKCKKYRQADKRIKSLVKNALKNWKENVPIEYLSGVAYNFRMSQGPFIFVEASEESGESDDEQGAMSFFLNETSSEVVVSQVESKLKKDKIGDEATLVIADTKDTQKAYLTVEDLERLQPGECLNDAIINSYLDFVVKRSESSPLLPTAFAFDTHFYTELEQKGMVDLKKWTKKLDVFAYDILIVPIHQTGHWALVIVDLRRKTISYYDSLLGDGANTLRIIRKFLEQTEKPENTNRFNKKVWLCDSPKDIPKQKNGYDCGLFLCCFADRVSKEEKLDFNQEQMPKIRKQLLSLLSRA